MRSNRDIRVVPIIAALMGIAIASTVLLRGTAAYANLRSPMLMATAIFLLAVFADTWKVSIGYSHVRFAVGWVEVPVVIGLLTLRPVTLVGVVGTASLIGALLRALIGRKFTALKAAFNFALALARAAIAAWILQQLGFGTASTVTAGLIVLCAVLTAELVSIAALSIVFAVMGAPFESHEWIRGHVMSIAVTATITATTYGFAVTVLNPSVGVLPFLVVLPLLYTRSMRAGTVLVEDRNRWERHGRFVADLDHLSLEESMRMLCTQLSVRSVEYAARTTTADELIQRAWVTVDGDFGETIDDADGLFATHQTLPANRVHAVGDTVIVRLESLSGTAVWRASGYVDDHGTGPVPASAYEGFSMMCWAIQNVIDSRRRLAEVQHRATHDEITGLGNRNHFRSTLEDAITVAAATHTGTFAVAMLDLDGFKAVNDTWGHAAGDRYLAHIARQLTVALPATATVARLSGDEFAVLLPGADYAALNTAAAAIRAVYHPTVNSDYVGSASFGYAVYPNDTSACSPAEGASALMRHADSAMYRAKGERSTAPLRFDARRDNRNEEHDRISAEITAALATGRLTCWYQPIFASPSLVGGRDRRVVMLEALARIETPDGTLMPGSWIPVAEATKQIHAVTERVLDLAVAQLAAWDRFDVAVAVNLSAANLMDANLVSGVADRLASHGVNPARLIVEVTETSMMNDVDRANAVLEAFRDLGVRVSIDDFGVGFSSMSRLLELPVDEIKIDRDFLVAASRPSTPGEDRQKVERARTILRKMVEIAHGIGVHATVEGIETTDALAMVVDMGADYVQGYVAERPMRAEHASALLDHLSLNETIPA